jgi:D-alanyl-lipoteichoic acid acyltransferase DltB (MBOAT superfamily)
LATRLTFKQYVDFRLGARGGAQAWFNFFVRPFGARSFAEFWRLWNPVYSYFLLYFVYRPLARVLPRQVATVTTFVSCGLILHDVPAWLFTRRILPPGATIAFLLFGVVVVVSDALHMDLSQWPVWARATTNLVYLGGCVGAMLFVVIRITG